MLCLPQHTAIMRLGISQFYDPSITTAGPLTSYCEKATLTSSEMTDGEGWTRRGVAGMLLHMKAVDPNKREKDPKIVFAQKLQFANVAPQELQFATMSLQELQFAKINIKNCSSPSAPFKNCSSPKSTSRIAARYS